MKILGYDISKVTNADPGRRQKSTNQMISLKQKYQTREDLRTLRIATDSANNLQNFNRYDLHQIYRRVDRDPELSAQWNTRVLKTLDKEFHVETFDGTVDKAAMEVFKAPWFFEWVRKTMEASLWGFTLIEFGPWDSEMNCFKPYIDSEGYYHDAVEAVDRDYVKPEFGMITPEYGDGRDKGISYFSKRFEQKLMFIGSAKKEDSIYYKIAPYMLMKENAHKNWSEWAEVFAMDIRVGKTSAQGEDRKTFLNALRDLGSNGYALIDEEDIIEYIGVNRQDAYQVYQYFLEYCDARISKLLFGQDVVTNNTGRVVGKVGEEVSNLYGDSDAKLVEWLINTRLIPFMNISGADLDGFRFKFDTTEKVKLADRAKIDKDISDMGFRIDADYIERTYGTPIIEYVGVPYSGREDQADAADGPEDDPEDMEE